MSIEIEDCIKFDRKELEGLYDIATTSEEKEIANKIIEAYEQGLIYGEWRAEDKINKVGQEQVLEEKIVFRGNPNETSYYDNDITQEYADALAEISGENGYVGVSWEWDVADKVELVISIRRLGYAKNLEQEERLFDDEGNITNDSSRIDEFGKYKY